MRGGLCRMILRVRLRFEGGTHVMRWLRNRAGWCRDLQSGEDNDVEHYGDVRQRTEDV
jgi:hypothetical protein